MHRCIPLSLLMCLAVPFAESAPKKGDEKPDLYLPYRVGDKKVFERSWDGKSSEFTEWVTAVETKGGMTVVSFAREEGGPTYSRYGASANGVSLVASGADVIDPPWRVMKLPAKEGETWDVERPDPFAVRPLKFKYTTGKEEDVEVPAGRFRAVRVDVDFVVSGSVRRATYWYAPGIGTVKTVSRDEKGNDHQQEVLKSFTPAAKK
jgi:hypothetical protein